MLFGVVVLAALTRYNLVLIVMNGWMQFAHFYSLLADKIRHERARFHTSLLAVVRTKIVYDAY